MSDFTEDGSAGGQNIRGYMDNERLDKIKDAKCEDLFDMDRKDFELYIYSLRKLAENNVESNRSFMTELYDGSISIIPWFRRVSSYLWWKRTG